MNPVVLVMGLPASGKSTITDTFVDRGYVALNRDTQGGKVSSLVQPMVAHLQDGRDVVLDNTYLTVESRAPFIAAAKAAGRDIECHWMQTSMEDCQVNALHRMWDRYGQVFQTNAEIKAHEKARKDPNMFPIAALFAARKRLNGDKKKGIPSGKPTRAEGFSRIVKVPFVRRPHGWTGQIAKGLGLSQDLMQGDSHYATASILPSQKGRKALILDYDGTLRRDVKEIGGTTHYPLDPSQVEILPGRAAMLQRFVDQGYLLLGVSTRTTTSRCPATAGSLRRASEWPSSASTTWTRPSASSWGISRPTPRSPSGVASSSPGPTSSSGGRRCPCAATKPV